jgi:hypothetical protein
MCKLTASFCRTCKLIVVVHPTRPPITKPSCHTVAAFRNAFRKVTTPGNLYSAFAATGFIPFSPSHPLDSSFIATASPGVFEGIIRRPVAVNAELLTDPDCLQRFFAEENGRVTTDQDLSLIDL